MWLWASRAVPGFRVYGVGFMVWGAGLRVEGSGFRVEGLGVRVCLIPKGSGFRGEGEPRGVRGEGVPGSREQPPTPDVAPALPPASPAYSWFIESEI